MGLQLQVLRCNFALKLSITAVIWLRPHLPARIITHPIPGHESTGRSYIVNYDGVIIADTGYYPGLAIARIDLDRIRVNAEMVSMRLTGIDHMREDFLRLRRPELYAEICRPVDNSEYLNNKFFDE